MKKLLRSSFAGLLCALAAVTASFGQSTEFSYQGLLEDNGSPANGVYDFEFRLFDQLEGGNQAGITVSIAGVQVVNGSFSVSLDFGDQYGAGDTRFLEITVRPNVPPAATEDLGGFTILTPRQKIRSVPFAVRSSTATFAETADSADFATNALQLGGVAAADYVVTTDPRLSDARTPTAGSGDYIQNSTAPQATSNFNISGTGKAAVFDAEEIFLSGKKVAIETNSKDGGNTSVGSGAGITGEGRDNVFFGREAGMLTGVPRPTVSASAVGVFFGDQNSFFGARAGKNTINGNNNAFFGFQAGLNNTGGGNVFLGSMSGQTNTSGGANTYVGHQSGLGILGGSNTFVGAYSGVELSGGTRLRNSAFGYMAGFPGSSINDATAIGSHAESSANNSTALGAKAKALFANSTAIGANALAAGANALILGSVAGQNGATSDTSVGIGVTFPQEKFHIAANGGSIVFGDAGCPNEHTAIAFTFGSGAGSGFGSCTNYNLRGNGVDLYLNRSTGGNIFIRENNGTSQIIIHSGGEVELRQLSSAGSTTLCRNASLRIATCSSSIRYKNNIEDFTSGADILRRLRPVTFNWKDSGTLDLGLVAEEVAEIEPLLATYRDGVVEGVKYDRIGVVLVNVVKEQQKTIEVQDSKLKVQGEELVRQANELEAIKTELAALKTLVCAANPDAAVCKR